MILKLHKSNQLVNFDSILVSISIQILLISQHEINVYVEAGSISREESHHSLKVHNSNVETNNTNYGYESIKEFISRGIFPLFDEFNFFGLLDDDPREPDSELLNENEEAQKIEPLDQMRDLEEDNYSESNNLEASGEYNIGTNKGWFTPKNGTNPKPPASHIILFPGIGGSRLEARWNKTSVPRYICDQYSDWVDVWVNVRLLLPYVIDCLLDNLRLEYDPETKKTHEPEGVEVRVKTPSKVAHVENLVDLGLVKGGYYAQLVNKLVNSKESGFDYKRDISILGAPYDFRRAPNELGQYFDNLKLVSEENFLKNDLKPVTFICHSMGCNIILYFLQTQKQEWKDKYVRRLISIAGPWGGSMLALKSTVIGYSLGVPYLLDGSKLKNVARTLPSTTFLFPHEQVFKNVPLVRNYVIKNTTTTTTSGSKQELVDGEVEKEKTNGSENNNIEFTSSFRSHDNKVYSSNIKQQERIYTTDDMKTFFDDINHPTGYDMWLETKNLLNSLEPPRVELWCFVGRGHKTLSRLDYTEDFPNSNYVEIYGDGDGTVNIESARFCKNWSNQQSQAIYYKEFVSTHIQLLKSNDLSNLIVKIINDNTSEEMRINA